MLHFLRQFLVAVQVHLAVLAVLAVLRVGRSRQVIRSSVLYVEQDVFRIDFLYFSDIFE